MILKISMILSTAFVVLGVSGVYAQDYPTRPITIVNPYSAGGGIDISARKIEPIMSKELGQQIVLDYRPGGNGFVGGNFVAAAAPDGYTLMVTSSGVVLNTLETKIGYDPKSAFIPVGRIVTTPAFLVVPENSPIKTVAELIALGKDPAKRITYAHSGTGTGTHMAAGQFAQMTGAKFVGVPYKGTGPQVTDVVAGVVDFNFMPAADALPRLGQGLRALAVTTPERYPLAPTVPTLQEAGVPGYEFSQWYGIFAPAGSPANVIVKLNSAMNKALQDDKVKAEFEKLGVVADPTTPEQFAKIVSDQRVTDRKVAVSLGLIQ